MDGLDSGAALMLHECCFYKVPALVLDPESDLVWQARFESISKESVTLHLFEESNRSFEPSRLFVSFYGNCCSFFATVLEYQSNTPPLA